MNTEEKILEMLTQMQTDIAGIKGDIVDLKESQQKQGQILAQHSQTLEEVQKTATRVALTQENIVIPQIKLLSEGHDTLLNTLARKDRVEALEDDVALLKTVIKAMSQRITELEKAQ